MIPLEDHGKPTGRIFMEFAWPEVTKEVIRVLNNLAFVHSELTLKACEMTQGISRAGEFEPFPARFDQELGNFQMIDRFTWKEWVQSGKQCIVANYEVTETRRPQLR